MSKEIAQTVGGKKIVFLFAILAAFAVFATLGSRLDTKPASANVATTNFVIDESEDQTVTITTNAESDDHDGEPAVVASGTTRWYELSICADALGAAPSADVICAVGSAGATVGAVDLTFSPGGGNLITAVGPSTGPAPVCTAVPAASVTCTYAAGLAIGSIGNLLFAVALTGPLAVTCTADDASAQVAQACQNQTQAVSLFTVSAVTCSNTSPIEGQQFTCSASVTYTGNGTDDPASAVYQFTDVGLSFNGGVSTETTCAGSAVALAAGQCTVDFTASTTAQVATMTMTLEGDDIGPLANPPFAASATFNLGNVVVGAGAFDAVAQTQALSVQELGIRRLTTSVVTGSTQNFCTAAEAADIANEAAEGLANPGGIGAVFTGPGGVAAFGGCPAGQVGGTFVAVLGAQTVIVNYGNNDANNEVNGNNELVFTAIAPVSPTISKIPSKSTVTGTPVDTFSWIILITNTTSTTLTNVVVTDADVRGVPNTKLVPFPASQTSLAGIAGCDVAANALTCPIGTMLPGASVAIVIGMQTVVGAADGVVSNTAVVNGDQLVVGGITALSNVVVGNNPVLSLVKSTSGPAVGTAPGGPTPTFTVTLTNTGIATLTDGVINDPVPAGLTASNVIPTGPGTAGVACNLTAGVVSASAINLPPGFSYSCSFDVNLTAPVASATAFVNTATATSLIVLGGANLTASAVVSAAVPGLNITKSASGILTEVGSTAQFVVTVSNTGTAPLGIITLTDLVDSRLIVGTVTFGGAATTGNTCSAGTLNSCVLTMSLAAGNTITVIIPVSLNPASNVQDGTVIPNTATASAVAVPSVSASASLQAAAPKLVIAKVASKTPVSTNPVQEQFSWYVTVTNTGSIAASAVTVTDILDANTTLVSLPASCSGTTTITCTVASLAPGSSASFEIAVRGNFNLANGTNIPNSASADCTNCPGAVDASTSTTVLNNPLLNMTKTGPSSIVAGSTITYTITLTNSGGSDATVTVNDAVPALLTGVSTSVANSSGTTVACGALSGGVISCTGLLKAGGNSIITLTGTVPVATPSGTTFSNQATLTSAGQPTITGVVVTTVLNSLLTVQKTNNPTVIGQNGIVTSTILVTNNGSSTANTVGISDVLPAGASFVSVGSSPTCSVSGQTVTCTGASLAPGSSTTFIVRWNVGTAAVNTQQCNVATSTNTSSMPNGTATACTVIQATVVGAVLRHVDIDKAAEIAAGNRLGVLPTVDDDDDATGSLHKVCLFDSGSLTPLGLNDDANIIWSITPAAGSSATVSPAPSGTKSVEDFSTNPAGPDPFNDAQANCVSWRSGGTGGQNITASHSVTGQVFYFAGTSPIIKEWNAIDSTKIVVATGNVVSPLAQSSANGDIGNWNGSNTAACNRDGGPTLLPVAAPAPANSCFLKANVDGATVSVTGSLVLAGTNSGKLLAGSRAWIEYALGSHVNYNGPIDGVAQTFTITGTCGSVRIEDPVNGGFVVRQPGSSFSLINSDKGVGFQAFPTSDGTAANTATANCRPGDTITITITSREDVQLRSDLDTAPSETITVVWVTAPPTNKQPILAWAGQRVVLEHDWSASLSSVYTCPFTSFYVKYAKQAQGPGQFINTLVDYAGANAPYTQYDNDQVVVLVNGVYVSIDSVLAERFTPNSQCVSTAMYESQDPGEVDVSAYIGTYANGDPSTGVFTGTSQQVDFLIYYMKFESVTIGIVDGARQFHNSGSFGVANPWDESKDKTSAKANVSSDVLIRVRVKGWFLNTNPTGRAAGEDTNKGVLPAGRWVMPDDWNQLAGGTQANDRRPNYDIMISPAGALTCSSPTTCQAESLRPATSLALLGTLGSQTNVVGPFSLVDGPGANDSWAPRVAVGSAFPVGCTNPPAGAGCNAVSVWRNTWLPDRTIDKWDAPMPVAQVKVSINATGAGFLKHLSPTGLVDSTTGGPVNGAADKFRIYTKNPFYVMNIPAEPWITQFNSDGSGYLWNTWGTGANSGEYRFWFDAAARSTAVFSANGKDGLCKYQSNLDDVYNQFGLCTALKFAGNAAKRATGGFLSLTFYSDNHGEVMAYANGDAGLTMDECSDAASLAANGIVAISTGSVFCEKGDLVGKSSVSANVDYPDKRKHYPLGTAAPVTIEWTWGGIKAVTLEKGSNPQFVYVVFHVTDRDGFCTVPTTQFIYTDINVNGTVTLLPLFVRTNSSTQPVVTSIGNDGRIPAALFGPTPGFTLQQIPLPAYAGYAVSGGLLGGTVGGTFAYQATTTDTGFPYVVAVGAYSLHSVLGERVDWQLDVITGGSIVEVPNGTIGTLGQSASTTTFDTIDPSQVNNVIKPLKNDPECQTWIRVSNSLLGIGNVLVTAYDPEGTIQFDRIIDFQTTTAYSLSFRWSLITWAGSNNISLSDALKGTGANDAGNDIFDQVTAVYGWDQAAQAWLGFFPAGVNVPGANDLTKLTEGQAYWIAIKGPGGVTWTIASNVN